MHLSSMRFKDYTWPHNPRTYGVEHRRRVAVHKIPFGGCVMQDLGSSYRVLRGEGVFAGDGAYEEFRALAAVFSQEGPGLLIHPVWQAVRARFVSLELEEEPLPDYVHYSFEFWEDDTDAQGLVQVETETTETAQTAAVSQTAQTADYTVRKGDTLWGIAGRYGVTLTALIAANPQIKNPNLIYPGDRVTIP